MATLNIKNFPAPLYEQLKVRAQRHHRSMAQEVTHLLESAVEGSSALSLLDLEGLGAELWSDIDAVGHVERERSSWG